MRYITQTLLVIAAILVLFMLIYHFIEGWDWMESFYSSVMITTLVGKSQPKQNVTKLLMCVQALLSFVIAGGLIVLSQEPAIRPM